VALLCGFVAWCGWLVFRTGSADSPEWAGARSETSLEGPPSTSPRDDEVARAASPDLLRSSSSPAPVHRCAVVDEEGSPIPTARLLVLATKDRWILESKVEPLALADSHGMLEFPAGWRSAPTGSRIVLRAPGYRSVLESAIPQGPSPERIIMQRAKQLSIRCIDHRGQPVRDAWAVASIEGALADLWHAGRTGESILPGPISRSAIHFGRANPDGVVLLKDLEPAEYAVALQSLSMVREETLDPVDCDKTQEVTAKFRSIWIVGVEVPGDRIIASHFSRQKDIREVGGGVDGLLHEPRQAAQQRWPGATLDLGVQWHDDPPELFYEILAERSGHLSGTLRASPLDAFAGPVRLQAQAAASIAIRSRVVRFCYEDSAGLVWPVDKSLQLSVVTPTGGTIPIWPDESGRCRVPFGRVTVRSWNRHLEGLVQTSAITIDESTPEDVRIAVSASLRECRIEAASKEGWTANAATVVTSFQGRSMFWPSRDLSSLRLVLPQGRGTISILASRTGSSEVPIHVKPSDTAEPQRIRLFVQPSAH